MFGFQRPVDRMQISQDARYDEQNISQSDTQIANSSHLPLCLPLKTTTTTKYYVRLLNVSTSGNNT